MEFINNDAVLKIQKPFETEFPIIKMINRNILLLQNGNDMEEALLDKLEDLGIDHSEMERYSLDEEYISWLTIKKADLLKQFLNYKYAEINSFIKRIIDRPSMNKPEIDYYFKIKELIRGLIFLLEGKTVQEVKDYLLHCRTYAREKDLFSFNTFSRSNYEETLYKKISSLIFETKIDKDVDENIRKSRKSIKKFIPIE